LTPLLAAGAGLLGVLIGAFFTRANVVRQIRATARDAWKREFREQVSEYLVCVEALALLREQREIATGSPREQYDQRNTEVFDGVFRHIHHISLLVHEKGESDLSRELMSHLHGAIKDQLNKFAHTQAIQSIAVEMLQREHAAKQSVWCALRQWLQRSRLKTWATGKPQFPDLP
jgi:hypothetical protein